MQVCYRTLQICIPSTNHSASFDISISQPPFYILLEVVVDHDVVKDLPGAAANDGRTVCKAQKFSVQSGQLASNDTKLSDMLGLSVS